MSRTIEFFKEISKIPRESGNEKQISDYICQFAKNRNLEYIQDEYNNVIIKKYTGKNEPIILQAHLDMVCEKEKELKFDFEKDSIEVVEDEGWLRANGTTLGADNGIGVAQMLNILDSDLKINIEAIFTVTEETTMIGAENIDLSSLKGKKMINLDGFNKNTIINESAAFIDIVIKTNFQKTQTAKKTYKMSLDGMEGGHSGFDIDKGKGNSSIELAKILNNINDIQLNSFIGGTKFNVIPSQAESTFATNLELDEITNIIEINKKELKQKYKNINITCEKIEQESKVLTLEESKKFLNSVINYKNGIFFKSEQGQPTTSSNLGVVDLDENEMKIGFRSSRETEKEIALDIIKKYCEQNNYEFKITSYQPGFETKKECSLIQELIKSYKAVIMNEEPVVKPVHFTVEIGFFTEKIPGLEVVIISPEICGAHTVKEKVEIQSIIECDKWLENFLENC